MDLLNLLNDFNSPSTSSSSSSTSSSPSYQLFLAASSGNLKRFHELTMKNKSSASFDILYNGYNTLHIATKKNHFSIVKYILEGGKVSNIDGGIEEVASEVVGREEVEKLLYSLTSDGKNCLMIAAYEGRDEILKYLIEKFFYQEIIPTTATATATATSMVDKLGNNILHYAAWGGQLNCIKICLELCKINPLITNNEGMNSLQFASAGNHVDCLIYLENYLQRNLLIESLSQVKESNTISESGLTSFHRACLHGAVDIVRHLLQQIENENQSKYSSYLYKNTIMDLPIDLQDLHSLEEIRRMYFQQGVYYPTHSGNTALHLSTQNNSKDIVTLLLDHIKNETIKFPLFYVDEDIGKASSRSKKGIDIQNNYGLTPLHFSCIG